MQHSNLFTPHPKNHMTDAWFEAARNLNPTRLKRILKNNIQQRDSIQWTALMHAASNNNTENIQFLLDSEKDINTQSNYTALMVATERGHYKACQHLLAQAGQRIKQNDPKYKPGTTALVIAAECGNRQIFDLLLPHEKEAADMNDGHVFAFQHLLHQCLRQPTKTDILGRLPLVYALFVQENTQEYKDMIRSLVNQPQVQNMPVFDAYGLTPLHYSVVYNNLVACSVLAPRFAGYGTNNNCKSFKFNTTALMIAVFNENLEFAQILCKYESNLKDEDNKTALMHMSQHKLSSSQHQTQLFELLKSETVSTPLQDEKVKVIKSPTKFEIKAPEGHESLEDSKKHQLQNNKEKTQLKMEDLQKEQLQQKLEQEIVQQLAEDQLMINTSQAKVDSLEQQVAQCKMQIEKMTQQKIREDVEKGQIIANLKQQLEHEQLVSSNLRDLYTTGQYDAKVLQIKIQSSTEQNEELTQQNQQLTSENEELHKGNLQLQEQISNMKQQIDGEEQYKQDIQQLQIRLEDAQKQLDDQNEVIKKHQQNSKLQTETISKHETKLQYQVEQIQMYELALEQINQKVKIFEELLDDQQKQMVQSKSQVFSKSVSRVNESTRQVQKATDDFIQSSQVDVKSELKQSKVDDKLNEQDIVKVEIKQQDNASVKQDAVKSEKVEKIEDKKDLDENELKQSQHDAKLDQSQVDIKSEVQSQPLQQSQVDINPQDQDQLQKSQALDSLKQSSKLLQSKLSELRDNQNIQDIIVQLKQNNQDKDDKIQQLSIQVEELQCEITKQNDSSKVKYVKIQQCKLDNEAEVKQDGVEVDENENNEQKMENKNQIDVEKENTGVKKEVIGAESENKEVEDEEKQQQIMQLLIENENLQAQVRDLEDINKIIQQDNKSLSDQRQEQQVQMDKMKQEKQMILDEYTEVKTEIIHINEELKLYGVGVTGVKVLVQKLKSAEINLQKLKQQCKQWMSKIME